MNKCCGNCGNRLELEQWNFRLLEQGYKKWKWKLPGFGCTACASEGLVVQIVSDTEEGDVCEMWKPEKGVANGNRQIQIRNQSQKGFEEEGNQTERSGKGDEQK